MANISPSPPFDRAGLVLGTAPSFLEHHVLLRFLCQDRPLPSLHNHKHALKLQRCVFKIPRSFHFTGWFTRISLLDYWNPQYIEGSIIPYHYQPTGGLNTFQWINKPIYNWGEPPDWR